MPNVWERIASVFSDALERPVAERPAFLDAACADDRELRDEVDAMLAAHDSAALRVESRLLGDAVSEPSPAPDRTGERVGAYRLVRCIGAGGMGEVWLAERDDDAYRRQVAVKLVRPGHAGALLVARFERERRILARLEHPNIATLYDGGVLPDGHPYLVMELVDGEPLTTYCDERRLPVRARLELFRTVCDAVGFAHANLVVHRDLKPSNILVARDGTVKLLDFGIAKLLDPDAEDDGETRPLERVLTPEYAAPEQIRGEPATTATDVYGLGVLLYELLAGDRPLRYPSSAAAEVERIVTEREPALPSRFVRSADSEVAARIARARATDPGRLTNALRGDLDAITMMALRKEPERRYRTAAELSDDIARSLGALPVRAQRDTATYRASRFLRRHRRGMAAAATVAVLLLAFAVTTAVQSRRVAAERDRAEAERVRSERVVEAMIDLFEATRPEVMPEGGSLVEFLEHGEAAVAGMTEAPDVQARMYETLGNIHRARGELERADVMFGHALEQAEDEPTRVRLGHLRAILAHRREGPGPALPLLRASYERHREMYGDSHPETASALQELAGALPDVAEARRLHEQALAIRRVTLPPGDTAIAASLNALGALALGDHDYARARAHFEEAETILAAKVPETDAARMAVNHNLAATFGRAGDWAAAEGLQRRLLATKRRLYGDRGDVVASGWEALGVSLTHLGRKAEAEEAFTRSLEVFEATLGRDHWRVVNAARNVGEILALQERYREGLPYFDRALDSRARTGEDDLIMRGQRAMVWLGLGETSRALGELRAALDDLAKKPDARTEATIRTWLGTAYLAAADPSQAETSFGAAVTALSELPGASPERLREARLGLAASQAALGRREEAEPVLRQEAPAYLDWGLAHPVLRRQVAAARASVLTDD